MKRLLTRLTIFTILSSIVSMLLMFTCCTRIPQHEPQFQRARAVIDSCPECALAILDSIPITELHPGLDSARYILLHAIAENKLYALATSDSTIQIAINVFQSYNAVDELRQAYYIQGRIARQNAEATEALVSLLESEKLIDSSTDPYEKGLIYSELAHCSNDALNGEMAISYVKQAYTSYKEGCKPLHAAYALHDLAMFYTNNHQYQEAIELYQDIIHSADSLNYPALKENALAGLGYNYMGMGDYRKAIGFFHQIPDTADIMDNQTIAIMADAEFKTGNNQRADSLAQILKERGDYKWIYSANLHAIDIDSLIDAFRKQELFREEMYYDAYHDGFPTIIEKHFRLKEQLAESQNRIQTLWILFLVSVLIIVAIFAHIAIRNYRKRLKDKQQSYFYLSTDFLTFLRDHNKHFAISDTLNSTKSILHQYSIIIHHLTNLYYGKNKDSLIAHKRMENTLNELICLLRENMEVLVELKNMVNINYSNIITHLEEEIPSLTEEERRLFLYMACGFSSLILTKIFELDNLAQFAAKKHRLKKKIMNHPSPSQHLFLKFF
ncbi:MAG: tetratricopeptide repeat protein [Bacteroidales bacterium]|nr:tetratricopeptide repeat protein [Bacteroidales bacterium]